MLKNLNRCRFRYVKSAVLKESKKGVRYLILVDKVRNSVLTMNSRETKSLLRFLIRALSPEVARKICEEVENTFPYVVSCEKETN